MKEIIKFEIRHSYAYVYDILGIDKDGIKHIYYLSIGNKETAQEIVNYMNAGLKWYKHEDNQWEYDLVHKYR